MTPDNGPQLRHGRLQLVVDYLILILATLFQLAPGGLHPAFDGFKSLRPARLQALAVSVFRRRSHENGHRLGEQGPQLGSPLHVDVEDHAHALAPPGIDLAPQRAIAVAVDLRPFQEVAGPEGGLELLGRPEVILPPVLLPRPGRPRRRGNRQPQRHAGLGQHPPDYGGLPAAARPRQDEQWRKRGSHGSRPRPADYSTFWIS